MPKAFQIPLPEHLVGEIFARRTKRLLTPGFLVAVPQCSRIHYSSSYYYDYYFFIIIMIITAIFVINTIGIEWF